MKVPLVSCLCVTEGRAAFMPWLLWNYDRQRYPNRELVIVDSSPEPYRSEGRADVRVIAAPPGTQVSRKRNLALRAAAGEIIAWFDDDDWQHPERLARLLEAIQGGAVYAGVRQAWFVHLQARLCRPHAGLKGQMVFNSAAFQREAVLDIPFPEHVLKASDTPWMTAVAARYPSGATWLDRQDLFFWLCHAENLSNAAHRRRFSDPLDRLMLLIGPEGWGDTTAALEALKARLRGVEKGEEVGTGRRTTPSRPATRKFPSMLAAAPLPESASVAGEERRQRFAAGSEQVRSLIPVSLLVKVRPGDAPYLETMVAHIQAQAHYPFAGRTAVVDRGPQPNAREGRALDQALQRLLSVGLLETVIEAGEHTPEMRHALETYFPSLAGEALSLRRCGQVPLHAYDGSPLASTLMGLEAAESDWVLQTDADIFFYTGPQSWVQQALDCLQKDSHLWLMMAHPGPPAGPIGNSLGGGNARRAIWDSTLCIWRFGHATTRYFLCDRRRLRGALRPLFLPQGFAPLEACISQALRRQAAFRGALGDLQSWHLHARFNGAPFPGWAPTLARLIEAGQFPDAQRGEYDLRLDLSRYRQAWSGLVASGSGWSQSAGLIR